uniref:Galactose-3-O-sulfotransferase 3 n=1 Tax=Neogobius melanostomus TaxID=47308 RepID=A0A8C6WW19_9GOBI
MGASFILILIGTLLLQHRGQTSREVHQKLSPWICYRPGPTPSVVFLKTHRTRASTVQNLLFRMGERDAATFPHQGYNFNYPGKFQSEFVDELPSGSDHFDIVMTADPIFITILRDPVHTFGLSLLFYSCLHSKNPVTFDVGINNHVWTSSWPADLASLEESFNLVMIAEHFDETLILLGALLNLELKELAYVHINSRAIKDVHPLHDATKAKIKAWNNLDDWMYGYFKEIFLERVKQYGRVRLQREVKLLRASTQRIRQKCLARNGVPPEELEDLVRPWQTKSLTILGYEVHRNLTKQEQGFCLRMVLPEHQYHAHLYYQQYGRDMKAG